MPASPLGRALGQYYRTCFKRFRSSWSSSAVGNGLNNIFFFSDQWEEDCIVDSAKAAALALALATATRCSPQAPLTHISHPVMTADCNLPSWFHIPTFGVSSLLLDYSNLLTKSISVLAREVWWLFSCCLLFSFFFFWWGEESSNT